MEVTSTVSLGTRSNKHASQVKRRCAVYARSFTAANMACLEEASADNRSCQTAVEALEAWLRRNRKEWLDDPITELEQRDAIREQAFGSAYATKRLEVTARYEVHLDRKLERTLSMLVRLRESRRPVVPV
jgi:hypothetical protein